MSFALVFSLRQAARACYVLWSVNILHSQRRGHSRARGNPGGPRIWIPAYAGMTFHRSIHAPGRAFNMHNTL